VRVVSLRRALPYAPGDWRRPASSVSLGLVAAHGWTAGTGLETDSRLQAAPAPALTAGPRGVRHLQPRLVFVTVHTADVAVLGESARC